jgi:hypothetical protein
LPAAGLLAALTATACDVCPSTHIAATGFHAGTVRALSCDRTIELREVEYTLQCQAVPADLLGPILGRGDDETFFYVARAVDGVAVEEALAVRESLPRAKESERDVRAECGLWRVALSRALTRDQASELLRRLRRD